MRKLTLRGLRAKKLRFVLTALAVMLGVSFMVGTLVLTDTIRKSFHDVFGDINARTDVVVRGPEPFETNFGSPREPVDGALVDVVRGVDGVALAEGQVQLYAQLVDPAGDPIGTPDTGAPTFGFAWGSAPELNPMRLLPGGRAPGADDEIVIDKKSADTARLEPGDRVTVLTKLPPKQYRIVGVARFGSVDSPLGATVTMFTPGEAQRIAGLGDVWNEIDAVAEDGLSQDELRDRVADALDGNGVEVVTGAQVTKEDEDNIDQALGFVSTGLLAFAGIALFVGCFIIYNTFSIVVAQRSRELALLRAIGASRRQVVASVLGESVVVGALASAAGIVVGVLLSTLLRRVLELVFGEIPMGTPVVAVSTVVAALVVGVSVTVLSAVVPALKASRVPPVAAMRAVAFERPVGLARRAGIGAVIVAVGTSALLYGLLVGPRNAVVYVALGALLDFVGVFVLGPLFARPVSRFLGAPLARLRGMTGRLAQENAARNPRRTSATAAALMVGVALVGFITIFAASLQASIASAIDDQFKADFIVSSGRGFGGSGLSPALGEELARLPELSAVTPVRFGFFQVGGETEFVSAADPRASEEIFDFGTAEGGFTEVGPDGIGVSADKARAKGWSLGDEVEVVFARTGRTPMRIDMIYDETRVVGNYLLSLPGFERHFTEQLDVQVFAKVADGVDDDEARAAIEPLVARYPTAKLRDQAQYKQDTVGQISSLTNAIYALLALAIVIALIGIANTLALSIYERTRELGLLRAVGMARSQVRSSVRWESVIISLFGTALGIGIGLFFGWVVVLALRDEGFTDFDIAPGNLALVVVLGALAGVIAAVLPARRAARLNVLEAIAVD